MTRLRVPFLCAILLAACAGPAEGEQQRDSLALAGDTASRRTLPSGPWDQCGRVGALTAASAGWREAARIAREDSVRADSMRADSLRADSLPAAGAGADSARAARGGGTPADGVDSAAAGTSGGSRARGAPARAARSDRGRYLPDSLPDVVPGSLFPGCRVVSYYGNPLSRRMGILGELPPKEMMARLEKQAEAYRKADSTTVVIPALELIAVVAQASPGRDSLYRARMADTLIKRVAGWAEEKGWLLILDIQVGHSDVRREVRWIMPYLTKPNVHLALDPEFDMPNRTRRPGTIIGTTGADDINWTIDTLAKVVAEHRLPPKMLIVHRFTRNMIGESERIRPHSNVQVVIDMDGFGPPRLKRDSYEHYIRRFPVQFAGFKLFYKNDKPIMTPEEVVGLDPIPFFIMYQ